MGGSCWPGCLTPLRAWIARGRLFVVDRHQAESVARMRGPVVLGAKPNVARLVLFLVVVAERLATGLGSLLVEPAPREYSTHRLDPHHGRARALSRDHLDLKACILKMRSSGRHYGSRRPDSSSSYIYHAILLHRYASHA